MKVLTAVLVCFLLLAGIALAAPIDGKWVTERKMERDGNSITIKMVYDLKSDGNKLQDGLSWLPGVLGPATAVARH